MADFRTVRCNYGYVMSMPESDVEVFSVLFYDCLLEFGFSFSRCWVGYTYVNVVDWV